MKKLAIVVGHNSEKRGAVRVDSGESEYPVNSRLARVIEAEAAAYGLHVQTFHRIAGGGFKREIGRAYDEVDRFGADASIELHFNAANSSSATGTETLSSGTDGSMRLARHVQREMAAALGLRDRGILTRTRYERGGQSLFAGRAPAILIEPYFGSNAQDCSATASAEQQAALAHAVLRGAAQALDAMPRADLSESRTMKAVKTQERTNIFVLAAQGATLLTGAVTVLDQSTAVLAASGLTQWLPYITAASAAATGLATVLNQIAAAQTKAARIDDHQKMRR